MFLKVCFFNYVTLLMDGLGRFLYASYGARILYNGCILMNTTSENSVLLPLDAVLNLCKLSHGD